MTKSKNKPNAFLFFMLEWKKTQEKKGRTFPNGLKDVQHDPKCNETWRTLSEFEKARYKEMGKQNKIQQSIKKRTGLGEDLNDLQRAEMKQQEFKDNMLEYISSLIHRAKEHNNLQKLQFYVVHVNFFYSRIPDQKNRYDLNEVLYYPAEIAIVEFSLEAGVTRKYHVIINKKIAIGFANSAKEHSMNTHHIPLEAPFGKSNYQEIFKEICAFLEPGKKNGILPPIYTMYSKEEVYYPTKSALTSLAIADDKPDDYLLLYSFEELFASIHNASVEQSGLTKIEAIVATIELKKDPFSYKLGLECEYHNNLKAGAVHCSLSLIKRWIYVLFSFCCDPLEITMIPGVHMPKDQTQSILNTSSLNSTFSSLTLNESKRASSLSMTGVSNEYRQRVSERTIKDEQRRKNEANNKPLEIIDHSQRNMLYKKEQEPIERPLRAPYSKSAVSYFETTDTESIDLSEDSFPSIGRGSAIKRRGK